MIDLANPLKRTHPLNRGLVACYQCLPGMAGGRVWRDIASKYHGVLTNMEPRSAVSGYVGTSRRGGYGAVSFDGTDDLVNLGSEFMGTQAITLAAWVYQRSNGVSGAGRIFDNGKLLWWNAGSDRLSLTRDGLTNISNAASGSLPLNQWIFVAVTSTATGVTNHYVNGVLSGTANQNSGTPIAGDYNVYLGNRDDSLRAWDGLIDDVRVYNRALSALEVKALYLATQTYALLNVPFHYSNYAPPIYVPYVAMRRGR